MKNSPLPFLLMLICGSAHAVMYSCVDVRGSKILRNYPCEKNEKQEVIEKVVDPSYSEINSTGERQYYQSRKVIYIQSVQPVETENNTPENQDGITQAASTACEKQRVELSKIDPNKSIGDAVVFRRLQDDYEINCALPPNERQNARAQRRILQKLNNIESGQRRIESVQQFGY